MGWSSGRIKRGRKSPSNIRSSITGDVDGTDTGSSWLQIKTERKDNPFSLVFKG